MCRCGTPEFRFIERSGFFFGFLFGLIQMLIFVFYDSWWVLPAFGFIVGYATNYIALYMIFRPLEPRLICCGRYTYQVAGCCLFLGVSSLTGCPCSPALFGFLLGVGRVSEAAAGSV